MTPYLSKETFLLDANLKNIQPFYSAFRYSTKGYLLNRRATTRHATRRSPALGIKEQGKVKITSGEIKGVKIIDQSVTFS